MEEKEASAPTTLHGLRLTQSKGSFPVNISLEDAREAIQFPGFRECAKDDYIVFNYDFSFRESFPDPKTAPDEATAHVLRVRRECRGLMFNATTNKVIARRLHKFFNITELPETAPEKIDINRPHVVLEKMDGCLVSPFVSEGKLRWGSKMGSTDVSNRMEDEWLPSCGIDYDSFAQHWIDKDFTVMFEWCSVQQQIVVGYPEDNLWLIAIRHNPSGEYVLYEDLVKVAKAAGIPHVKAWEGQIDTVEGVLSMVKGSVGYEGYVLCFQDTGEMYKMKSDWYFERSKKIAGSTLGSQEKDVWRLILNNQLDDIAVAVGERRRERMEKFASDLFLAIDRSAKKIQAVVDEAKGREVEKRAFVAEISKRLEKQDPEIFKDKALYFAAFDGQDPAEGIIDVLKKASGNRNKLNQVRYLAEGLKYVV